MNTRTARQLSLILFLLTGVLAASVYYPGLTGDYVFDDMANLLDNTRLDMPSLDAESLLGASLSSGSGLLRRPVSMLSFALNRYFFGIDPYSHKLVNLVIHLLTGLGLFIFSRLLMRSYRQHRNPQLSEHMVLWLPLVVTGLWLVHPLNLTSVLYIVQRMTSLATLFMTVGLCLYVLGRDRMMSGKPGLAWILTGSLACGALAVLSKESGALLPLYMLVLEVTLFRFRNSEGGLDKSMVAFFALLVLVPACLFLLYLGIRPGHFLGAYSIRDFSLVERLLTEARVLVFYLKLIIMPSINELGLYHDDIAISRGLLDPPATLYSIGALIALLLGAFLLLGKRPLVSLGILWFFAGHLLESTLLPLEIAHEHRNYLADFGIILAVSSAVAQAPLHKLAPLIRIVLPCLLLVSFSYTTWLRAGQWSDNISQAVYGALHHPDSFRSVYAAGRIHGRLALNEQPGSEAKAFAYLDRASALGKTRIMPDITYIKLAYLRGQPVDEARFEGIVQKLAAGPVTNEDLGSIYELIICPVDKCSIPHETMENLFRSVLENPGLEASGRLPAEAFSLYGYYLVNNRGRYEKGLDFFTRAVNADPQEPQRWINLIDLLTSMQRLDEAERQLALFRARNTYGGNQTDYKRLQQAIDSQRIKQAS